MRLILDECVDRRLAGDIVGHDVTTAPDLRQFAARIIAWQARHGRHDLPWQNTRDAYRIWLSEIMLQQTQVTTVLPYYTRFVASFPDVRALASAPLERVLEHWSGLGYYRRAHHLHAAALTVVEQHGGIFPTDAATLATLPGIGRSTAAAIAAFSSSERGAILDGNVKRVLARHAGVEGFPGDARVASQLWSIAQSRLPDSDIERYTQGLMDLGATVCMRTRPRCDVCPVSGDCVARSTQRVDVLPGPRPRKVLPQRALRVLVLEHDGRILLEQRPPMGIWGGLLSLPELALDADIDVALRARFDVTGRASRALPALRHGFTHFGLTLHPQWIAVDAAPHAADASRTLWLTRDAALAAALPAPIKRVLRALPA